MSREENPTEAPLFESSISPKRVYMVDPTKQELFEATDELEEELNGYSALDMLYGRVAFSYVDPRPRSVSAASGDVPGVYRGSLRGGFDRRYRPSGWWSRAYATIREYRSLRISVVWWTDVAKRRHITLRGDVVYSGRGGVTAFACDRDPQRLPMMACPPLWTAVRAISKDGFSLRGRFYDPAAILIACDHVEFDPRFERHVRIVRAALQPQ